MTSIVDGTERTRMLIADLLEYPGVSYDTMNRESVDCQLEFEETVVLLSEAISEQGAAVSAGPAFGRSGPITRSCASCSST